MRLRAFTPALAVFVFSCGDPTGPRDGEILAVVSGNGFSCALAGENVQCWGRNDVGQLGRGVIGDDAGPGLVTGNLRFKLLDASHSTVCGVTLDDAVVCWGQARILGITSGGLASPTIVPGIFPASIASIGVGLSHGCVRSASGAASCFGANANGELGSGTISAPSNGAAGATTVIGGHVFSQISVGAFHTCGVESGGVWCWGWNFNFPLGPGTTSAVGYPTPTRVTLAFSVTRVEAGSAFTCALDAASKAWCWGHNLLGQLGRGAGTASTSSAEPAPVSEVSTFVVFALSRLNSTVSHACGVAAGGVTHCWGAAEASQLGRASTEICTAGTAGPIECSPTPAPISSSLSFERLAPGRDHTCGLANDGAVYCWGSNARRQLGGAVSGATTTPVLVPIAK